MGSISLARQWLIQQCEREDVGYSQIYRENETVQGITYFDCSSIIWYSLVRGGFILLIDEETQKPFTTSDMGSVLLQLGFTRYNSTEVEWREGDIVWRAGHCEMVYTPNRTMGAHSSHYELKDQVSINDYETNKGSYKYVYRYESSTVKPIPYKKRKRIPRYLLYRWRYYS